jgi:hypothetical protein
MYNDEEMDRQLENIINDIFTSSDFANLIELLLDDMQEFREENENVYVAPTFDSFPYQAVNEDDKVECSICLIDFENNDDVTLLKCCHCFHKSCIEEWSKIKAECPNCREKI